jgi:hypothetical protein
LNLIWCFPKDSNSRPKSFDEALREAQAGEPEEKDKEDFIQRYLSIGAFFHCDPLTFWNTPEWMFTGIEKHIIQELENDSYHPIGPFEAAVTRGINRAFAGKSM